MAVSLSLLGSGLFCALKHSSQSRLIRALAPFEPFRGRWLQYGLAADLLLAGTFPLWHFSVPLPAGMLYVGHPTGCFGSGNFTLASNRQGLAQHVAGGGFTVVSFRVGTWQISAILAQDKARRLPAP